MAEIYGSSVDLGTMHIVTARDDGKGNIIYNTMRDCYRELPYDPEFEDTLKNQHSHYVRDDQRLYVLGNDAYLQAGMAEFAADIKGKRKFSRGR